MTSNVPPFEPPLIAIFPLAAYLFSTNHSLQFQRSQLGLVGREPTHEAAMKSSKQFTYQRVVLDRHFRKD
jgi:hypothetical protein